MSAGVGLSVDVSVSVSLNLVYECNCEVISVSVTVIVIVRRIQAPYFCRVSCATSRTKESSLSFFDTKHRCGL